MVAVAIILLNMPQESESAARETRKYPRSPKVVPQEFLTIQYG